MYQLGLLYLACVLAGFALTNLPDATIISPAIATFFAIIGVISIIVFSLALLYLGIKALLGR